MYVATYLTRARGFVVMGLSNRNERLEKALRLGEMYSLTWENVNVSRKVLTIPRSKQAQVERVPEASMWQSGL
jgi:hypothetical protein